MRSFHLSLIMIFVACGCKQSAQHLHAIKSADTLSNGLALIERTIDSPYYYKDQVQTVALQGGYKVCYAQNDSMYFLYLKKGDTLSLLNKTSNATSLHHLGVISGDEKNYFILGHDNGNGSPYTYEYIDKRTGKNPLGFSREFLALDTLHNDTYLLYPDTATQMDRKLILYDITKNQKEFFPLETAFFDVIIDTLTDSKLLIAYTRDKNRSKIRVIEYRRQRTAD